MSKEQSSGKDEAYEDRNLAVLSFLKSLEMQRLTRRDYNDLHDKHYESGTASIKDTEKNFGWKPAPDEDEDDWAVVWAELPRGQVTWHVPRDMVEDLDWLPKEEIKWDFHTREIKNKRVKSYIGLNQKNGDNQS